MTEANRIYTVYFLSKTVAFRSKQPIGLVFKTMLNPVSSPRLSYLMEGETQTGAAGVVQCVGSQRGHTTVAWLSGVSTRLDLYRETQQSRAAAVCCA